MLDALLSLPSLLAALLSVVPFLGLGLVSTDNGEVIQAESILEGVKRVKLPQGRYEDLELEITANNKNGDSVTFSDLGSLRLLRNGDNQMQTFDDFDLLAQIHDEYTAEGSLEDTTDGGTSTLRTRLSQRHPLIAPVNALHVPQDEATTLVLEFDSSPGGSSGLNALAHSGQVKVIGYKNPAVAEQVGVMYERTAPQFSGSGTKEIQNITGENVAFIFINDPDDVLKEVSVNRLMPGGLSDETVFDDAPIGRVQRQWERITRDFGASNLYGVMVPASPASQDTRNLGVDLEVEVTGATSNLEVLYSRIVDPIPTGSPAGPQQRAQTLSGA
jgi:hypothetical protein